MKTRRLALLGALCAYLAAAPASAKSHPTATRAESVAVVTFTHAVPSPGTLAVLGLGALAMRRRRRPS